MDMQYARILSILGKKCKRNPVNHQHYFQYLKKAVALPCRLTGRVDFPWESATLKGGWESNAYQEMRKDNPSFMDQYELQELLPPPSPDQGILARIKRSSDRKSFEIELSWLECVDFKDENYQLLDDYASWLANY